MPHTRRSALSALAVLPAFGALSACAPRHAGPHVTSLGMVTDVGGLGDRSFNDSAYAGLLRAQRELHARITVLQSGSAADYQVNMTVLANKEYDEIYAIGFLMAKDVADVAERYPDRHFAIVDAVVAMPNVTSVTFKEEEGSFLAGALAAMVTRRKTIAFLGGMDIPLLRKFEAGFTAGAHEIDPTIAVLVKYAGSFDDVAAGKELGGVLYDQGADIIYVAAGKAGLGAIEQAKQRANVFAIGVDSDQDALAPGKILTSVVKRVDVGVFRVALEAVSHRGRTGHLTLGLRDGGVSLTKFAYTRDVVTVQKRVTLSRLTQMIEDGAIRVPSTREELASFTRVPL